METKTIKPGDWVKVTKVIEDKYAMFVGEIAKVEKLYKESPKNDDGEMDCWVIKFVNEKYYWVDLFFTKELVVVSDDEAFISRLSK